MSSTLLMNPTAFDAGLKASFEARKNADAFRQAAFKAFSESGFPHRRVEGWKWSDFHQATRRIGETPARDGAQAIPPSAFARVADVEIQIIDGVIASPNGEASPNINITVDEKPINDGAVDAHPIAALNLAMTERFMTITVSADAPADQTILIRRINTGAAHVFFRASIRVEKNASVSIIDCFEGVAPFMSDVCHVDLAEGATARRFLLDSSDENAITHSILRATLGRDASLEQTSLSTGSRLCRHETHLTYTEENARSQINSASLLSGDSHADFTTVVRHDALGCVTRQNHKSAIRDKGRAVFQGKFLVNRVAQKTDADMQANALLLSDNAEANHKPELEIYADDVECAHGSTAGALDEQALFYMRQRGLSKAAARTLLIKAFVAEALEAIDQEDVADVFQACLDCWLEEGEG